MLYGITGIEAVALVVRRASARTVWLRESSAILEACGGLLLDGPPYVEPKRAAALHKLVIEPLELGDDAKRVLVSPAGRLSYVPFALLMPTREVVYVPSATTHGLLAEERDLRGKRVLALGDPNYRTLAGDTVTLRRSSPKLEPLPATREEVAAIADLRLVGDKATETGLVHALAGDGRWRAVHFACHGLIDPAHPMLSSLALTADDESDGFLTCREVFDLKIPTDLVVLSACETGKGKIYKSEGIVGFTRAFMYAGAPRVIVSLWKVDDAATKALMVKFYELWKTLPTATALKKAQEFVKGHEKWSHPSFGRRGSCGGYPSSYRVVRLRILPMTGPTCLATRGSSPSRASSSSSSRASFSRPYAPSKLGRLSDAETKYSAAKDSGAEIDRYAQILVRRRLAEVLELQGKSDSALAVRREIQELEKESEQ